MNSKQNCNTIFVFLLFFIHSITLQAQFKKRKTQPYKAEKIEVARIKPIIVFKDVNEKFGLKYEDSAVIISGTYDTISGYNLNEPILVQLNNKWGFINTKGEVKIPLIYDTANWFINGLASATLNHKYGFIDTSGKQVIPFIYDYTHHYFSFDRTLVQLNKKWGFINSKGQVTIPIIYDSAFNFQDGYFEESSVCLAFVKLNNKAGFINIDGKIVIPIMYDYADNIFTKKGTKVRLKNREFYIDEFNREIFTYRYKEAHDYSEGLAAVKLKDKWGFINAVGKVIIPFKYYDAETFSEGLACVKIKNKYGYINKKNMVVLPFVYNHATHFIRGEAEVDYKDKTIIINKAGKDLKKQYSGENSPWY